MTGVASQEHGPDRAIIATDSALLADHVAALAHDPQRWTVESAPLPFMVAVGIMEGDAIVGQLQLDRQRWIGHAGRMGYALHREPGNPARRLIVAEKGLADWLQRELPAAEWLEGPELVRAISGNIGWVCYLTREGARAADALLNGLGAVRVTS